MVKCEQGRQERQADAEHFSPKLSLGLCARVVDSHLGSWESGQAGTGQESHAVGPELQATESRPENRCWPQ